MTCLPRDEIFTVNFLFIVSSRKNGETLSGNIKKTYILKLFGIEDTLPGIHCNLNLYPGSLFFGARVAKNLY